MDRHGSWHAVLRVDLALVAPESPGSSRICRRHNCKIDEIFPGISAKPATLAARPVRDRALRHTQATGFTVCPAHCDLTTAIRRRYSLLDVITQPSRLT